MVVFPIRRKLYNRAPAPAIHDEEKSITCTSAIHSSSKRTLPNAAPSELSFVTLSPCPDARDIAASAIHVFLPSQSRICAHPKTPPLTPALQAKASSKTSSSLHLCRTEMSRFKPESFPAPGFLLTAVSLVFMSSFHPDMDILLKGRTTKYCMRNVYHQNRSRI